MISISKNSTDYDFRVVINGYKKSYGFRYLSRGRLRQGQLNLTLLLLALLLRLISEPLFLCLVSTNTSGISKNLAKIMRPLFQSGVGPHRLHKVLRVLHSEKFDELQFQYYDKMVERISNPNLFDMNMRNRSYEEFTSFGDKIKYAGYVPCSNYLSNVYSSLIQKFVPFMDQLNSVINGVVLKVDHSFKLIKHMGKTNGAPVFAALYTLMNEYEENRMQVLAHTKSLKDLSSNFATLMESYTRYEFKMPEVTLVTPKRTRAQKGKFRALRTPSPPQIHPFFRNHRVSSSK